MDSTPQRSNDLITPEDMVELTGAKLPSKQCEMLRKSGIRFSIRANGSPALTWEAYNRQLAACDGQRQRTVRGFNLDAL